MTTHFVAGRYEVKRLLAMGGMGVVYEAVDLRTDSLVAIKTLRDGADPATLEMFKKERTELASLCHPNIVEVRDVDEIEENGVRLPCFIMPLLPGCTLASLINSHSPRITVSFVVDVISQACRGLQAAHGSGLIHRDLKPSNIFVMNDDTVKIIDFGLVHSTDAHSATGVKGTWKYMAPEQIDGKKPTAQSDIFSLGIVAYEALTGCQPFDRGKIEETTDLIKQFNPPPASEINPLVSQALSQAVHVALAKRPANRYASMRDFAETLQKAFNNQPIERFDTARTGPRIERARNMFASGHLDIADEILHDLEAEGSLDPQITLLRAQVNEQGKHKRIDSLLEGAETRFASGEMTSALVRVDEALALDALNADVLVMRKRIIERQSGDEIEKWLQLTRQHLDQNDFQAARQAVKEIFQLRYDHREAAQLNAEIDSREQESQHVRAEKEELYVSAIRAQQTGEISSALSKLERIVSLSRQSSKSAVPEREKVYLALYHDVRSERDRLELAYQEGSRRLSEKNFEKAAQVCEEILSRYPRNAQFQALKLRGEQLRRQDMSAYVAEVGNAVETEPNLERRVGLLQAACERYPAEPQFQRQLALAREHLELASSILARAREHEERGQFSEALGQWKILASIHPQYPNIEFELAQLERRRAQQVGDDQRNRMVERIDRTLETSSFDEASRLATDALAEFPGDSEFASLQRIAQEGRERTGQAARMLEEARALRDQGKMSLALEKVREALRLDRNNIVIRNVLVKFIVEEASRLVDSDLPEAGALVREGLAVDPNHIVLSRLAGLFEQRKEKEYIEQCVAHARGLQATDPAQALVSIEAGLERYPLNGRLLQTRISLQNQIAPPPPKSPSQPAIRKPVKASAPIPTPVAPTQVANDDDHSRLLDRTTVEGQPIRLVADDFAPEPVALVPVPVADKKQWLPVSRLAALAVLLGVVLLAGGIYLWRRASHSAPAVTARQIPPPVKAAPPPVTSSTAAVLQPTPVRFLILNPEPSGTVSRDGQPPADLVQGENELSLPADSASHTFIFTTPKAGSFSISVQATPGAMPGIGELTNKGLIVMSTFDAQARLLTGSPARIEPEGQPRRTVPPEGLMLDLTQSPDTLPVVLGNRTEIVAMPSPGAASITLLLSTDADSSGLDAGLSSVVVSSEQKDAELSVDGKIEAPRKPGVWSWKAKPGTYQAKLTAAGMLPKEFPITVVRGKSWKAAPFILGPDPALSLSTLNIANGTPESQVFLDGTQIGALDSSGKFVREGVQPGFHEIQLRKAGYKTITSRQQFAGGKSLLLPGKISLDAELGSLKVALSPKEAKLTYRREGETESHALTASESVELPAGKYEVAAQAQGYQSYRAPAVIESGRQTQIEVALGKVAPPPPVFDSQVKPDGTWFTGKSEGPVLLHPNAGYAITFRKPEGFLRRHSVEWTIALDNENKVTYRLDGQHLSVKPSVDGAKESGGENVPAAALNDTGYSIIVLVQQNRIEIRNGAGARLHEWTDNSHNWSRAQISLRGDQRFMVSSIH